MKTMKLAINIDCGNAAFDPEPGPELARILRQLAEDLDGPNGQESFFINLRDLNGNVVGCANLTLDPA